MNRNDQFNQDYLGSDRHLNGEGKGLGITLRNMAFGFLGLVIAGVAVGIYIASHR
ncbi:hypothetical protein KW799_01805 [Candidatus Parcubacteria bacterium]|nr:hypothetical protein [Candidatus Parcubacteria bacterium]